jgi:hypothetical protein
MAAELITIKSHHVHDCAADREKRPCRFDWRAHVESDMCACGPRVDQTNMMMNGEVFVVHQGVC